MADSKQNTTYTNLTKRQINALPYFVNPEIRTITEIADKADVCRSTIYDWLDDDNFKKAVDHKIENYTDSQTANMWKSLIREGLDGDVRAIKLFFELKNKYKDRKEITGKDGGPIEIDAKNELAAAINRIAERKER